MFTTRLAKHGVNWEEDSPVTAIMIDEEGHINPDLLNERVLSAIIEFKVPQERVKQVLEIIRQVDKIIDTVFTVGIVSRVGENNKIPVINVLDEQGFHVFPNAKINIGLGKPRGD